MDKTKFPKLSYAQKSNRNFRLIKITDLYKDVYSSTTGEAINNLKKHNQFLKMNRLTQSLMARDKLKAKVLNETDYDKHYIKTTISSKDTSLQKIKIEEREVKDEEKLFTGKLLGMKTSLDHSKVLEGLSNVENNEANESKKGTESGLNTQNSIDGKEKSSRYKGSLFKTSFPIVAKTKSSFKQSVNHDNLAKFYCPYCEHCNNMKDQNLDMHMQSLSQANIVINKGFEYIVSNLKQFDKTAIDLFSFTDRTIDGMTKDEKLIVKDKEKNDINEDVIEKIINKFPKKAAPNRMTYKVVSHFLNALIDDELSLERVVAPEVMERIKDSLISKGMAYEKNDHEHKVFFDKELEQLFDDKTKLIIEKLFEKKYLRFDLQNSDEYLRNRKKIGRNDSKNKLSDRSSDIFKTKDQHERKFIILFLIFIQILSEVSSECKERGILLYKFFKIYFVEQENKWIIAINKMKEKVKYYKELCKTIMQMKNQQIDKIEEINDILFTNKLSKENLNNHKILIHNLLKMNNEKREEIYLVSSQKEILEKELRFWVYDFDRIKLNTEIRNRMKEINLPKLVNNIHDELSHKSILSEEKSMLINADRFLLVSGQRFYFYEQKKNLQSEIERLNELYKKYYYKKKKQKVDVAEMKEKLAKSISRYESEIAIYKSRLNVDAVDNGVQTDIDIRGMNKIIKNHESVVYFKSLSVNKLTDYIERIRYGCSRSKPIAKKSLLNLIPEIYNEKIDSDSKADMENGKKVPLDEFFHKFMEEKFKLRKLVKKHCEETIMAILQYSNEDNRIDLIRRFLGIGEDKLSKFIFEIYLILIKSLPVSFYKLYEENHNTFFMNTELCFEIFHAKLREYKSLANETKYALLRSTQFSINDKEQKNTKEERIYEYMLVNRFYNKAFVFLNQLLGDYRNNGKMTEKLEKFYEPFSFSNKEFIISQDEFVNIFTRLFKVSNKEIDLDHFFHFFENKKFTFRIKNDDFIELSLNSIIAEHVYLNNKLNTLFDLVDMRKRGIVFFKEFEELMTRIFVNQDTRWKNNDYFLAALCGQEKEFISKEEFIVFALNSKDIIQQLSH